MTLHKIPVPVPALFAPKDHRVCSECTCNWSTQYGEGNERGIGCDWDRCPCHDVDFQTVLYEAGVAA
jgi:hypothetical protein